MQSLKCFVARTKTISGSRCESLEIRLFHSKLSTTWVGQAWQFLFNLSKHVYTNILKTMPREKVTGIYTFNKQLNYRSRGEIMRRLLTR